MLIFLIIVLISVLLYLYFYKFRQRKVPHIKELYAEGLDMLVSGKHQAAYKNFKEIVQKDSDNVKAYIRLGQVLREGGNELQSIKIHKSLLIRKKMTSYELIELYKNLSLDYYKINDITKSIEYCIKILEIENNYEWALHQLVILYKKNNDWEKATEYLKLYFSKTGKKDIEKLSLYKVQQAKYKIKENLFEEARLILEKVLDLKSDSSEAYYFLAKSYSEESNIEYEKAIKIQKENSTNLSDSKQYNEHLEEAKKILSKAVPLWVHFAEIDPDQSWLVLPLIKDSLFVLNRFSELENILKQMYERFPNNVEILAALADYYSHKGEVDKAISILSSADIKEIDSILIDLIKIKLELQKDGENHLIKDLDNSINSFVKNIRYQFSKNSTLKSNMLELLEDENNN